MSQLDEAIARYHRMLQSDAFRDMAWVPALRERMEAEKLSAGGRLLCPFLRPHLITRRQYEALVKTSELLVSAVDRMQHLLMEAPALLGRLDLLPAEKMLATIEPGYKTVDVICRLDSHLTGGALHLVHYNADSPSGIAWADGLSELFYNSPPVKEFRKRHTLTRVGGKKHLLAALLGAYKQFGGKGRPKIAILEFRSGFSATPSEYELFRDFFRREGYDVELVSPDQLEFRNGVLRRGPLAIDLVYRRISVQEFLQRFDLTHPLVQAYRARAVCMVNSFRSELADKRAFLGLLTDESLTGKFPAAERKAIAEHVPWTRLVAPSKTTRKGRTIDLEDYILKHRETLVLKPNDEHSGQSTFLGWEMDAPGWDRAMQQTRRAPYVVQERVDPAVVQFPLETYGHLEFKDMRVDLHPHAYLGRVLSCSSWLSSGGLPGFSSSSGLAPTYILEGSK
ncbi:MAG: circularly permuted type 2 ATP-grasp protein [Acidobacteria bacterium]|nr:circularly permuted type 2 ATP-grasp protein [Acidobacteriota bacterium]MBI3471448.1 circularly permuted type 2 ATP-grasp protein [Candidatus Solibacter usitatus]